jgi:putative transposase
MCRVLGVSRSSYYDWVNRLDQPPPRRVTRDEALVEQIKSVHAAFAYYGSPRVHRELLKREQRAGRHHIARLMRDHGIRARRGRIKSKGRSVLPKRRAKVTDQVKRKFDAERPNRLWFTDLTMIRTGQGWLRAAVILDAFNREVISWAVADHETPSTAMNALRDAIAIRRPAAGCVIHSDRGYQGGFNWSSQHLDQEVARWPTGLGSRRFVRIGGRFRRRGDRRSLGVRIGSGSGQRSRAV